MPTLAANDSPPTVLVVDDEIGPRETVGLLLRDRCRVLAAPNGVKGIHLVQQHRLDVAVVDLCMPGLDGIETLQRILELDPHLCVIILTAYGSLDTAQAAIRAGATDYQLKPIEPARFEATVLHNAKQTRIRRARDQVVTDLRNQNDRLLHDSLTRKSITKERYDQSRKIIHDLNNALFCAYSGVELLLPRIRRAQDTDVRDMCVQRLEGTRKSLRLCGELMRKWSTAESHETAKYEEVAVRPVLEEVMAIAKLADGAHDLEFELLVSACVDTVNADRMQLFRAVYNIVLNAVHAVQGEGRVTVGARTREGDVEIRVRDNGMGIAPEDIERIFEPYFTHKGKDGSGLGLTIARSLIEEMSGIVTVWSERDEGAEFVLKIPVYQPNETTPQPSQDPV